METVSTWMQYCCFFLVAIMMVCSLGGCVLAPPASESLVFQRQNKNSDSDFIFNRALQHQSKGVNIPQSDFGNAFHFTFRPAPKQELRYAKNEFSAFISRKFSQDSTLTNDNLNVRNSNYVSLSASFTIIDRKNIKWNVSMGIPVVGTDITVRLAPETFVTANIGYMDGELILQQKIIDRPKIGLSLGGYYRAERRGFIVKGEMIQGGLAAGIFAPIDDLFTDKTFYNHLIGGRVMAYLPLNSSSYIHVVATPGYAFNLKKVLVNLSVGIQFPIQ